MASLLVVASGSLVSWQGFQDLWGGWPLMVVVGLWFGTPLILALAVAFMVKDLTRVRRWWQVPLAGYQIWRVIQSAAQWTP